ncbi:MAG TPA: hypothetical protein VGI47_04655 [Candidatus Binataceae bacterium]
MPPFSVRWAYDLHALLGLVSGGLARDRLAALADTRDLPYPMLRI